MGQSTLDLLWDSTLINPISPLFFARVHAEIISDKPIGQAPNPIQMPEVSPPQTISGGITHGVSQFIVGFIPAVRATKFIKPLKNVGSWVKGMIAGSVTDFTVFSPHEERLSNLVQEFPELANPITEYLQAKPDDSFAEGRLKNSLEGIIAGGLAEPLTRSLRLLKYARIKITGTEVRTKVHHKIEAVEVELDEVNWNNVAEKRTVNQQYLTEMSNNGVKFSPENVLRVEKLPNGKIVFLEKGNLSAGLQHIIKEHADDFAKIGVSESQIPDVVMDAVSKGKIIGYQGKGTGRPIYEVLINGQKQRIAVTTGNNGFIVGANPAGSVK